MTAFWQRASEDPAKQPSPLSPITPRAAQKEEPSPEPWETEGSTPISVLGPDLEWQGTLKGRGTVRIEGQFSGTIALDGTVVVAPGSRVEIETLHARMVVVSGEIHGPIVCERLLLRRDGRLFGDIVTTILQTEEGAFLSGRIQMVDQVELPFEPEAIASPPPPDENATT